MNLHNYFHSLANYHTWATHKLLDTYLAPLSDDEWRRDCGLFFNSIHGTLNHLLVADNAWYARFAGNPPQYLPLDTELHTDRAELCAALHTAVARWRAWIDTLDATLFDSEPEYIRNSGQLVRAPFATALGHVFNHATHHRGQISAAVTAMGYECPELDWIYQQYQEMKSDE